MIFYLSIFQDVEFPSITVCNLNQVEASFMKDLGIYGNTTMTKLLYKEYINGHNSTLSHEEEAFVNKVILTDPGNKYIKPSFLIKSSQQCKSLFTSISFQGMEITWKVMRSESSYNSLEVGPHHFSTDFGACCTFIPHLHMKPIPKKTPEEVYHGLKAKALNGESNGLEFVLDAEQFNYAYYDSNSVTAG